MRSHFVITVSFIATLLFSGTSAIGESNKGSKDANNSGAPSKHDVARAPNANTYVTPDNSLEKTENAQPKKEDLKPQISNNTGSVFPPEPWARNTIDEPSDFSSNEKDLIPIWLIILLLLILFLQTAFFYFCINKHSNSILQSLARISNKVSFSVSNVHEVSDPASFNYKEINRKLNSHVDDTDRLINETNQRIDRLQNYLQQTNTARSKSGMDESLKRGLTAQQTQPKSNNVSLAAQDKTVYIDAEQLGVRFLQAMKECDWKFDKAWDRFISSLDFPIEFKTYYYDLQSSLVNDLQPSKPDNWLNPVSCRLLLLPSNSPKAIYLFNSLLCEYCPAEQDFRFCNVIKADPNFSRERLVRCRPPTIILQSNVWQASEKGEIVYQ